MTAVTSVTTTGDVSAVCQRRRLPRRVLSAAASGEPRAVAGGAAPVALRAGGGLINDN
jgi:hypothetical protein